MNRDTPGDDNTSRPVGTIGLTVLTGSFTQLGNLTARHRERRTKNPYRFPRNVPMNPLDTPRKECTNVKTVTHLSLPATPQRLVDRAGPSPLSRAQVAHLVRLGFVVSTITVLLGVLARLVLDLSTPLIVLSTFVLALAAGTVDSAWNDRSARPSRVHITR